VRGYNLEGCVTILGVVPYEQSLVEMKKSSVLVLIAPEVQFYGIPAKTFEYIAIGRPILCLGDRGATADLIRQSRSGVVVDPSNPQEIRNAIEQLYTAWRDGHPMTTTFDTTVFERSRLTRELIDILR
jgi:glycosyltransferase involved in cell wall biosynthesis